MVFEPSPINIKMNRGILSRSNNSRYTRSLRTRRKYLTIPTPSLSMRKTSLSLALYCNPPSSPPPTPLPRSRTTEWLRGVTNTLKPRGLVNQS